MYSKVYAKVCSKPVVWSRGNAHPNSRTLSTQNGLEQTFAFALEYTFYAVYLAPQLALLRPNHFVVALTSLRQPFKRCPNRTSPAQLVSREWSVPAPVGAQVREREREKKTHIFRHPFDPTGKKEKIGEKEQHGLETAA